MKKISFLITIFITTFITAQESSQNKSDFDFGNGVSLSFEDGDYNFSINGYIKPTYVYNEMTSIVDGGTINEFNRQFKSKNSVLEISGNAKKEKVSFSIRMDYSLSNPLLEAWVGYHPSKSINVYFGQKNSFLNNREMIFNEDILQFTDRSLLSQNHTNSYGQEFGLFIKTTFGQEFILSPKFAVTSGDGRNSFGEDSRDSDLGGVKFGARLDLYPFGNFSKGNEGSVDLVGEQKLIMELGFAYSKNIGTSHRTGNGHGDIMFYDADGNNNLPDYEKIFIDLLLKYKGFSFLAEYADAAASGLNQTYTDTFNLLIPQQISEYLVLGSSYNFQLGYIFQNDIGIDFRYEFSTPEFTNEINNSYENSILQDFENMSLGISKYFDNNNLKIQVGVSSIKYFYGDETTIAELVCQIRL
ncbi:hypothetical protein N9373_04590 [Flavobacteriaceae bacterium]|nr:hypothetical protein [Flavobacteriaceae bacterium]|tara:strand:- start:65 stop:1306 length:1242 start_codon:yes stop_codon:yes gene_type:complete